MATFTLREGSEYIELNKLLKVLGWVGTGGEANQVIDVGEVRVNSAVETQRRKKLRVGDKITFEEQNVIVA